MLESNGRSAPPLTVSTTVEHREKMVPPEDKWEGSSWSQEAIEWTVAYGSEQCDVFDSGG